MESIKEKKKNEEVYELDGKNFANRKEYEDYIERKTAKIFYDKVY